MIASKKTMARNLLLQMQLNNVTAADVCRALKIKSNTFSDWVNAKTYPRIDKIEMLADYFKVNKAMLVEDISDMMYCSPEESAIITAYRDASSDTKSAVAAVLGVKRQDTPLEHSQVG